MTIQDSLGQTRFLNDTIEVLRDALLLGDRSDTLDADSLLLGSLPELDSMAVVTVVLALEEKFQVAIDGDEIDAEVFETVGKLAEFIERKVSA